MEKIAYAIERKADEIDAVLHPIVKEWFFSRFEEFSLPQRYGVMSIYERKNILISAPTGGTKTLTAFLSILNYLVTLASKKELEDKIYAVYISPLKALSSDIYVNLVRPLKEIMEIAKKNNVGMQAIKVGLRTGDTSQNERQKMAKQGVHIMVTTPESLAIMLTTTKFAEKFSGVEFCILDEIHALANKRGVHLSLSLERLEYLSKITPVRIGLSATVAPLEEIAAFLVGAGRECVVADVQFSKKKDIKIESIDMLNVENAETVQKEMYGLLDQLIKKHKTTLIFTNTRAATERVVHHLKELFPDQYAEGIGAHHSSLSKEHRFNIEERLREGKLKVIVSSTSLELGIDIGYIDLVILLGSPKSTARAMQRIGRSGHKLHETAKGRFVVLDKDDLVECAVMSKDMMEHKIDKVQIPKNCLDVLSQQIYGMAIERIWDIKELFSTIKKSYCYKELEFDEFLNVISYLAGEYALEERNIYAKIWYDRETKQIGKRGSMARVIYMTNVGTIPEESYMEVVIAGGERTGAIVGMIDEAFLERMKPGDVFVLGGSTYQYAYTKGMKAFVRSGVMKKPTIPSWFSEMLPLSFDLALEIQRFRKLMAEKIEGKESPEEIKEFIKKWTYSNDKIAEEIYNYMKEQQDYMGIPHEGRLIIEIYKAEKNYAVFHTLYGRRVNDALSRAVGFLVGRLCGRDVEIGISDNGFYLTNEVLQKTHIERAMKNLNSRNISEILPEVIEKTEILKRRFRHCAARSLMILKTYRGRKKSVGRQQMSSSFMLYAVRKITKDFPILKEARREVLEDVMDIKNAAEVLKWIENGKIKISFAEKRLPSPFSLGLIMQGYSDLITMENRIEFLKRMYEEIKRSIKEEGFSV